MIYLSHREKKSVYFSPEKGLSRLMNICVYVGDLNRGFWKY
jgi:hypothetical protein